MVSVDYIKVRATAALAEVCKCFLYSTS